MTRPDIRAQIGAVEREIGFRVRVYPRRVEAGKMSQKQADDQIELMRAVLRTLHKVEEQERLL